MADPGLSGLGPRDRRRALRNRAARQRFLNQNPLAPLTDRELLNQSTQDVTRGTLPLTRQINREAAAGEANIAGIAKALAGAEGGYQAKMADIYTRARGTLGALDTSQAAALGQTQGGGTLAGELGQRLALGGAGGDLASGLQAATAGASGAGFARGGAELGALAQRQAAAEEYAAKLPELARLTGVQGVQERAAAARQSLQRVQSQIPGQVTSAVQAGRNREYQKAVAAKGFGVDYAKVRASVQTVKANLTLGQQKANEAARHNKIMEGIDQTTAEGRAAANRERHRHNVWVEKHPKAAGGGRGGTGHTGIDTVQSEERGVLIDKKTGKVIKYPKGTRKHGKDVGGKPIPYSPGKHGKSGGGGGGVGSPKN